MVTDYRAIMLKVCDGFSYAEIQRACSCSSKTVSTVRQVVTSLGLDRNAVEALDDEVIAGLFPDKRRGRDESFAPIPMDAIIKRFMQSKKRIKIKVEWERYRRKCEREGVKAYGQSQFYRVVADEIAARGLTWPQDHEPGRAMLVDWSGDKMWVGQPHHPDSLKVSVFVASLPYSGLFFAKAFVNERTPNWIQAHVDALSYFGGCPQVVVPDNASTSSFRPRKGDPGRDICTAYRQFGDYYQLGIIPTAPGEPTHKAHVERSVGISQDWLNQFLSDTVFDTLGDLNEAIYEQVEWINKVKTPYRGCDGHTRFGEFVEYEQHTLGHLPDIPWEPVEYKIAVVRLDCHFQVDKRRYSVPYKWAGKRIRVGLGKDSVVALSEDGRVHICTHQRNYGRPGSYQTDPAHQPPDNKLTGRLWTKDRYLKWAGLTGPYTLQAITIVLNRPKYPQQAFLGCENIMHLAKRYSRIQLEEACKHVITAKMFVGYRNIKEAITPEETDSSTTRQRSATRSNDLLIDDTCIEFTQAHVSGH